MAMETPMFASGHSAMLCPSWQRPPLPRSFQLMPGGIRRRFCSNSFNQLGLSINGGTPKMMVCNGKSHLNDFKWMIWGYPPFRKPPILKSAPPLLKLSCFTGGLLEEMPFKFWVCCVAKLEHLKILFFRYLEEKSSRLVCSPAQRSQSEWEFSKKWTQDSSKTHQMLWPRQGHEGVLKIIEPAL